jgi:hypothetical protein
LINSHYANTITNGSRTEYSTADDSRFDHHKYFDV